MGPTSKSKEKKRSHRKVTRLVLTVVTVYVLCWLPYWVSQVSAPNPGVHPATPPEPVAQPPPSRNKSNIKAIAPRAPYFLVIESKAGESFE